MLWFTHPSHTCSTNGKTCVFLLLSYKFFYFRVSHVSFDKGYYLRLSIRVYTQYTAAAFYYTFTRPMHSLYISMAVEFIYSIIIYCDICNMIFIFVYKSIFEKLRTDPYLLFTIH